MNARRAVLIAASLTLPMRASAQALRGVVVEGGDRPVAGVVLLLMDGESGVAARALSNERGEFRLAAPGAGLYRVRTMRIGFRPVLSEKIQLDAGADVAQRIVVAGVLFSLDTVRVVSHNACRAVVDSGAATFAVWEQARTALTATQLTGNARAMAMTTLSYERALDPVNRRVRKQSMVFRTKNVTQPWMSLPPETLRRIGYVVVEPDGSTTFRAPDLEMLLSNVFLEDHCFKLTSGEGRIGIAFEPTNERRRVPEIRGTLWLDRASSQLRSLELRYVNVEPEQERIAGADMEFVRMSNGAWAISRWSIRMPVMEQRLRPGTFGGAALFVREVRVEGGEVVLARLGRDTLWMQPLRTLSGSVVDSGAGVPIAGARVSLDGTALLDTTDERGTFQIAGVLSGEYALQVRTPSLDSASAVHQTTLTFADAAVSHEIRVPSAQQVAASTCPARSEYHGIVIGSLRMRGDTPIPRDTKVRAEWDSFLLRGEASSPFVVRSPRGIDTRADASGVFRLCGVPIFTALVLSVESDSAEAELFPLTIPQNGRFARADLTLDRPAAGVATRTGVSMADSSKQPIAGAELPGFEEHRRTGLGHFFTREQIKPMESMRLSSILGVVPGMGIVRGPANGAFVSSTRAPAHGCKETDVSCLREHNISRPAAGGPLACYSQVYRDSTLMNPGRPTEAFDVNSIPPSTIEALEYYSSSLQTPRKYNNSNASCGVLVIWTRRAR